MIHQLLLLYGVLTFYFIIIDQNEGCFIVSTLGAMTRNRFHVGDLPTTNGNGIRFYSNDYATAFTSIVVPTRKTFLTTRSTSVSSGKNLPHYMSNKKNHDDDDDDSKKTLDDNRTMVVDDSINVRISTIDPFLIYTDIFTIVIACQLMGLIDVLNDTTFWTNGGWFQPMLLFTTTKSSSSLSSLPVFLQRIAINAVGYISITFISIKGSYEIDTALLSLKSIFRLMVSSVTTFTLVRCGLCVLFLILCSQQAIAEQVAESRSFMNHADKLVEVLRECYFVAIATTTGRFALYNLFQR